jgi:serine-type D-Ala-D-Ala carboxypeptidase
MEVPRVDPPPTARRQHEEFVSTRTILEDAIAAHDFPGCAWSVLFAGEIRALDAMGRFTYEPTSAHVTPSTIYDLASLTKVLATTALAMLLYDRNLLELDRPIHDFLPAFGLAHPEDQARRQVTVRMLLAHNSGIPGYARLFEQYSTPETLFDACLRLPLEAPPGTRAEYSDIGFILLGRILEGIVGERLDTVCEREIFEPLSMTTTRFRPPRGWRPAIPPTENDTTFRHRVIQGEVHDENAWVLEGVSGHAGLFSNALDPLRFAQCLLAGGRTAEGKQLFKPETVRLFTTRTDQPPGSSRALGWDTPSQPSSSGKYFSRHSAGHLGFTGTSLWIDFDAGLAAVLLTNRTWPDRQNQAIQQLRPRFHDSVVAALLPEVTLLTKACQWVTS